MSLDHILKFVHLQSLPNSVLDDGDPNNKIQHQNEVNSLTKHEKTHLEQYNHKLTLCPW